MHSCRFATQDQVSSAIQAIDGGRKSELMLLFKGFCTKNEGKRQSIWTRLSESTFRVYKHYSTSLPMKVCAIVCAWRFEIFEYLTFAEKKVKVIILPYRIPESTSGIVLVGKFRLFLWKSILHSSQEFWKMITIKLYKKIRKKIIGREERKKKIQKNK